LKRVEDALRGIYSEQHPIRPEFRDYMLARNFGYTRQEIDDQPAVWLDWLLMIDGKFKEAEAHASSGQN
jgi:hypothetical protein